MVTGISLHPNGTHLLSNGSDNTIRCWDVKPFCEGDRCEKVFLGAQHNYEKMLIKANWSKSGSQIAAGSAA
jgi:Prp8 binding protein